MGIRKTTSMDLMMIPVFFFFGMIVYGMYTDHLWQLPSMEETAVIGFIIFSMWLGAWGFLWAIIVNKGTLVVPQRGDR